MIYTNAFFQLRIVCYIINVRDESVLSPTTENCGHSYERSMTVFWIVSMLMMTKINHWKNSIPREKKSFLLEKDVSNSREICLSLFILVTIRHNLMVTSRDQHQKAQKAQLTK